MTITPGPTPALDKIQIGLQTAFITAVTPTAQLGGVEKLEIDPGVSGENLQDLRGSAAEYHAVQTERKPTAKMSGWMTYEDAPYLLDALFGTATPGASTTYNRAYIGMLGTIPDRRISTLVKGQASPVAWCYGLTGAFLKKLVLKIETGKRLMYDADYGGYLMTTSTLASLSDRTQTPITAAQGSLYIDAAGGTMGATQITTTWFSAELSIDTKADSYGGIGSTDMSNYHETPDKWAVTIKYMLELDATSKAMFDSTIGTSLLQKLVRMKFTTGATQIFNLDVAGSILKSPTGTPADKDGVSTIEFEQTAKYDTVFGNYIKANIINSIATMP